MEVDTDMPTPKADINILVIPEEGNQWTAVALELSLLGEGSTAEEAIQELREAIKAQVSFAKRNDSLESIFIPAAKEYFEIFEKVKIEVLKQEILAGTKRGRTRRRTGHRIGGISLMNPRNEGFEPIFIGQ